MFKSTKELIQMMKIFLLATAAAAFAAAKITADKTHKNARAAKPYAVAQTAESEERDRFYEPSAEKYGMDYMYV